MTTGPFANLSLPLGPFPFATNGDPKWTLPNPHCLRRDLKSYALPTFASVPCRRRSRRRRDWIRIVDCAVDLTLRWAVP